MVSLRVLGSIGAGLLAMTSLAQASSIVVAGIPTSTPSVVRLPAIAPGALSLAPSLIALGEPVPAVTDEKVAAIPEHAQAPMIIRGGVVGGAFATPAPAASAKATTPGATTPAATAPANGTASTTPPNGTPPNGTPPNGTASMPPNGNAAADRTANASGGTQPAAQKPVKQPSGAKTM